MKRTIAFLLSVLVLGLVIAAFSVGKAVAASSCFTDTAGNYFEAYICWLKDNGITTGYPDGTYKPGNNITRGEMAAYIQRANKVAPQSGLILVSAGNANWMPVEYNSTTRMTRNSSLRLTNPDIESEVFTLQPDFSPVLYGKSVELVGVEFCYTASETAYLDYVEIRTQYASNSSGSSTIHFTDYNNYTDAACRYYLLSTPQLLGVEDGVSLFVTVHWTLANVHFYIGRTTFVFQPTGTASALPASYLEAGTLLFNEDASLGDFTATLP